MDATKRIVLLGKTGAGKSSLANTIFGEAKFQTHQFDDLKTHCLQAETKSVDGRSITLIDTPGFFDTDSSEEEMKPEMVRCIRECAPGPHAFLIVLKVDKFTEQERAIINRICQYFGEDALKYAVAVFTQGDQLPEGMKIQEYVDQSEGLSDLVRRCGGRCCVVDNKYWKNQEDEYRSNQLRVAELLNTIDKMVMENNGGYYTNEIINAAEREIQTEEERIGKSAGNMSEEEIRKQAKSNLFKKDADKASRTWFKGLVGLTVVAAGLAAALVALIKSEGAKVLTEAPIDTILMPLAEVVEQAVVEPVKAVEEVIETVIETVIPPVAVLENANEAAMDTLWDLFERTYDPFNPFD